MNKEVYDKNVLENGDLLNTISFALNNFSKPKIIENYIKAFIVTKQLLGDKNEET